MVESQRRGDIVAVLPQLRLAAVDGLLTRVSVQLYAAQAAKRAGWTAVRAE